MRTRTARLAAVALVAGLLAGCSTTRITSEWTDPNAPREAFRKVVVVALSRDAALRRIAEDAFVQEVGAPTALAGYSVIPDDEVFDRDKARARIEAAGADGAVVFRLAGVEEQERWVPPSVYHNAWGYWGYAAPMVYDPGYLVTDQIVQIETGAYRVPTAALVWSARSETLNPSSAKDLADDVVRAAVKAMREDGLLPPAR
jgi:hypothetical protein